MYVDMDGEYDKKPYFDFYATAECQHGSTCVKLIKESDLIYFNGKLTAAVTEYTATLNDATTFKFIFGTMAPPVPPAVHSTVEATSTKSPTTQADPEPEASTKNPGPEPTMPTKTPKPETEPVRPETTSASGESNGTDGNGDDNEPETVPTTSCGSANTALFKVVLIGCLASILGH